ncbi:hypothetical protein [Streptacidiphilus sp. PAMC 29251]
MADGESGGRSPRVRIWVGLITLATGCYCLGDTAHRARTAAEVAGRWWPWALLALALINLLRSTVARGSGTAPLLLGGIALSWLTLSHGFAPRTLQDLLLPAALALVGTALLLSVSRAAGANGWTRILTTGRITVPAGAADLLTLRAVAGELRTDLTAVRIHSHLTLHVTAIGGHVHLTLPAACRVTIHSSGAFLTRIADPGPRADTGNAPEIVLHVLGVCGAVSIVRA